MNRRTTDSNDNATIGSVTYINGRKCIVGEVRSHTVALHDYITMKEVAELPTKELNIE